MGLWGIWSNHSWRKLAFFQECSDLCSIFVWYCWPFDNPRCKSGELHGGKIVTQFLLLVQCFIVNLHTFQWFSGNRVMVGWKTKVAGNCSEKLCNPFKELVFPCVLCMNRSSPHSSSGQRIKILSMDTQHWINMLVKIKLLFHKKLSRNKPLIHPSSRVRTPRKGLKISENLENQEGCAFVWLKWRVDLMFPFCVKMCDVLRFHCESWALQLHV